MGERLAGKVAIVTGAAQGMGEAIARRFAAEGAEVVLADIQQEKGAATAAELGAAALFVRADVTATADWTRLTAATIDRFGRIDILVNNAGGAPGVCSFMQETADWHRRIVDLNLTGTWAGMQAVIPHMIAQGGGSIVNISSMDGLVGAAGVASYSAAKFAVTGLTRSVALDVGKDGVRVNSVHPGMIATPLVLSSGAAGRARIDKAVRQQPIPRMGKPEEVAAAILFFASDESSFCTGSALVVDGGHIAGPPRAELGE
jgi:3alpha(or 20beta)-hydroxysteroid dehydrogenase